jgi:geranylgeranyl diphosphate synthase type II
LTRFGFHLGAAFQIRDDLLNLEGRPERYGKEILGDLYEGKRTLMIIHLLSVVGEEQRAWLDSFLSAGRGTRSAEQVQMMLELMRQHGSIEFAREFSRGVAAAAREAFDAAFEGLQPSEDLRFIEELIPYMLDRDL